MFRELARPTALVVDAPPSAGETPAGRVDPAAQGSAPDSLSAAIFSSDPAACSSLRHMLLQTGLVKESQEWTSAKAVELRHSRDVPDIVFLDLNGTAQSDFAFAQQLAKLRPSVHIVACSAK